MPDIYKDMQQKISSHYSDDTHEFLPMHHAAATQDIAKIQLLLATKIGFDALKSFDTLGFNPIQIAAFMGNTDIMSELLWAMDPEPSPSAATPNIRPDSNLFVANNEYTALHIAIAMGHFDIVKQLLVFDAKYVEDKEGHSPLYLAYQYRRAKMAVYLWHEATEPMSDQLQIAIFLYKTWVKQYCKKFPQADNHSLLNFVHKIEKNWLDVPTYKTRGVAVHHVELNNEIHQDILLLLQISALMETLCETEDAGKQLTAIDEYIDSLMPNRLMQYLIKPLMLVSLTLIGSVFGVSLALVAGLLTGSCETCASCDADARDENPVAVGLAHIIAWPFCILANMVKRVVEFAEWMTDTVTYWYRYSFNMVRDHQTRSVLNDIKNNHTKSEELVEVVLENDEPPHAASPATKRWFR